MICPVPFMYLFLILSTYFVNRCTTLVSSSYMRRPRHNGFGARKMPGHTFGNVAPRKSVVGSPFGMLNSMLAMPRRRYIGESMLPFNSYKDPEPNNISPRNHDTPSQTDRIENLESIKSDLSNIRSYLKEHLIISPEKDDFDMDTTENTSPDYGYEDKYGSESDVNTYISDDAMMPTLRTRYIDEDRAGSGRDEAITGKSHRGSPSGVLPTYRSKLAGYSKSTRPRSLSDVISGPAGEKILQNHQSQHYVPLVILGEDPSKSHGNDSSYRFIPSMLSENKLVNNKVLIPAYRINTPPLNNSSLNKGRKKILIVINEDLLRTMNFSPGLPNIENTSPPSYVGGDSALHVSPAEDERVKTGGEASENADNSEHRKNMRYGAKRVRPQHANGESIAVTSAPTMHSRQTDAAPTEKQVLDSIIRQISLANNRNKDSAGGTRYENVDTKQGSANERRSKKKSQKDNFGQVESATDLNFHPNHFNESYFNNYMTRPPIQRPQKPGYSSAKLGDSRSNYEPYTSKKKPINGIESGNNGKSRPKQKYMINLVSDGGLERPEKISPSGNFDSPASSNKSKHDHDYDPPSYTKPIYDNNYTDDPLTSFNNTNPQNIYPETALRNGTNFTSNDPNNKDAEGGAEYISPQKKFTNGIDSENENIGPSYQKPDNLDSATEIPPEEHLLKFEANKKKAPPRDSHSETVETNFEAIDPESEYFINASGNREMYPAEDMANAPNVKYGPEPYNFSDSSPQRTYPQLDDENRAGYNPQKWGNYETDDGSPQRIYPQIDDQNQAGYNPQKWVNYETDDSSPQSIYPQVDDQNRAGYNPQNWVNYETGSNIDNPNPQDMENPMETDPQPLFSIDQHFGDQQNMFPAGARSNVMFSDSKHFLDNMEQQQTPLEDFRAPNIYDDKTPDQLDPVERYAEPETSTDLPAQLAAGNEPTMFEDYSSNGLGYRPKLKNNPEDAYQQNSYPDIIPHNMEKYKPQSYYSAGAPDIFNTKLENPYPKDVQENANYVKKDPYLFRVDANNNNYVPQQKYTHHYDPNSEYSANNRYITGDDQTVGDIDGERRYYDRPWNFSNTADPGLDNFEPKYVGDVDGKTRPEKVYDDRFGKISGNNAPLRYAHNAGTPQVNEYLPPTAEETLASSLLGEIAQKPKKKPKVSSDLYSMPDAGTRRDDPKNADDSQASYLVNADRNPKVVYPDVQSTLYSNDNNDMPSNGNIYPDLEISPTVQAVQFPKKPNGSDVVYIMKRTNHTGNRFGRVDGNYVPYPSGYDGTNEEYPATDPKRPPIKYIRQQVGYSPYNSHESMPDRYAYLNPEYGENLPNQSPIRQYMKSVPNRDGHSMYLSTNYPQSNRQEINYLPQDGMPQPETVTAKAGKLHKMNPPLFKLLLKLCKNLKAFVNT